MRRFVRELGKSWLRGRRGQGAHAVPGKAGCYGKLPFDKEFLCFGLGTLEAEGLSALVDGTHQILTEHDRKVWPDAQIRLASRLSSDSGAVLALAVVRGSADGGGRSYPIAFFTFIDSAPLDERSHLAAFVFEKVWAELDRQLLAGDFESRLEVESAIEAFELPEVDLAEAEKLFEESTHKPQPSPWASLVGADAAQSAELAKNFARLGDAQRGAEDGAGLALRLAARPTGDCPDGFDGPMLTASWIRLLREASGEAVVPGVVEIREVGAPLSSSVCLFHREIDAAALAFLMAGVGGAGIDELEDKWDDEAESEASVSFLSQLLNPQASCLSDLWRNPEPGAAAELPDAD